VGESDADRALFGEDAEIGSAVELACHYVADSVRRRSGANWLQGAWRKPIPHPIDAPPLVRFVAQHRIKWIQRAEVQTLVAWARERWPVEVFFGKPDTSEVLALQASGSRCLSIVDAKLLPAHAHALAKLRALGEVAVRSDVVTTMEGLWFIRHDLAHLRAFFDARTHLGQVGFFRSVLRALADPSFEALRARLDAQWEREWTALVADTNGASLDLFAKLRDALGRAARRYRAREDVRLDDAFDVLSSAMALRGAEKSDATLRRHFDGIGARYSRWWKHAR
jgi:hypothetical protein